MRSVIPEKDIDLSAESIDAISMYLAEVLPPFLADQRMQTRIRLSVEEVLLN